MNFHVLINNDNTSISYEIYLIYFSMTLNTVMIEIEDTSQIKS